MARVDAVAGGGSGTRSGSSSPDGVGQSVDVDVARPTAAAAALQVFCRGIDDALARRGEPTHARATR